MAEIYQKNYNERLRDLDVASNLQNIYYEANKDFDVTHIEPAPKDSKTDNPLEDDILQRDLAVEQLRRVLKQTEAQQLAVELQTQGDLVNFNRYWNDIYEKIKFRKNLNIDIVRQLWEEYREALLDGDKIDPLSSRNLVIPEIDPNLLANTEEILQRILTAVEDSKSAVDYNNIQELLDRIGTLSSDGNTTLYRILQKLDVLDELRPVSAETLATIINDAIRTIPIVDNTPILNALDRISFVLEQKEAVNPKEIVEVLNNIQRAIESQPQLNNDQLMEAVGNLGAVIKDSSVENNKQVLEAINSLNLTTFSPASKPKLKLKLKRKNDDDKPITKTETVSSRDLGLSPSIDDLKQSFAEKYSKKEEEPAIYTPEEAASDMKEEITPPSYSIEDTQAFWDSISYEDVVKEVVRKMDDDILKGIKTRVYTASSGRGEPKLHVVDMSRDDMINMIRYKVFNATDKITTTGPTVPDKTFKKDGTQYAKYLAAPREDSLHANINRVRSLRETYEKAVGISGEGISKSQPTKLLNFGKYLISVPDLQKLFLNVKTQGKRAVKGFNRRKITPVMKSLLIAASKGKSINQSSYDDLSEAEKRLFDKLIQTSGVDILGNNNIHKLNTMTGSDLSKDINQFDVLKGAVLAGNNNPDLIKDLKYLTIKMMHYGLLSAPEGRELLLLLCSCV